jgi:myo-inositol-1-phosphate synthase
MTHSLRLAVAGIGNNISALIQGIHYYHKLIQQQGSASELPGLRSPVLEGFSVADVEVVAAFDVDPNKIGCDVADAIFVAPNNYPRIGVEIPQTGVKVVEGLRNHDGVIVGQDRVTEAMKQADAEVLLYSLPTGLQWALDGYVECALAAGAGLVNCTPESAARKPESLHAFAANGLALVGDDLASQFGASVVHRALLSILMDRGLDLTSSYQINIGGNEDFRNLRENGASKLRSKINALNLPNGASDRVEVIPSGGYLAQLYDNKISMMNIEGRGWGGTSLSIDLRLKVQDSSNAAGVIIDLIRYAAAAVRDRRGGFVEGARSLLKSPPPLEVAVGERH